MNSQEMKSMRETAVHIEIKYIAEEK